MRCSKCDKRMPLLYKFCQQCGTAVTPKQKKINLIILGTWVLIFLLSIPIIYFLLTKYDPDAFKHTQLYIFITSAFCSFLTTCCLIIIYFIVSSIIHFIIWQPILGSIVVGAVVILIGTGVYFYLADKNNNQLVDSLNLIQENLNEATAAKIMGDSIIAKKPTPGASMIRVEAIAQMAKNNLDVLVVPRALQNYRDVAVIWSLEIAMSAKDNKNWSNLADHPIDFQLKLTDAQTKKLFQNSIDKIIVLKEFGDEAIKHKDTDSMRYIAAKLLVQKNWLDSLAYSKNSWFSLDFVSPVLAAFENVPPVGPGTDVTCQVCNDSSVRWTTQLRAQYGCDTRCRSTTQNKTQTPPPTDQKDQGQTNSGEQNQGQTGQNNQPSGQNDSGSDADSQGSSVSGSSGNGTSTSNSATPTPRKVCIGRGGTSTGNSATDVFCVEDAIQSTNEIAASAVDLTEGKKGADKDWDDGWHKEGGLGVISQDNSSNQIQAFNDACTAKGGTVGGNGGAKNRLPSTEFGYTCGYKQDNNDCWDYLTYSGGRYMGGAAGCPEKNLLPPIPEDVEAGSGWDGNYPYSTVMKCNGSAWKASSFPVNGTLVVHGNQVNDSGITFPVSSSGVATEVVQFHDSQTDEEGNVYTRNASAVIYYNFYKQGDTVGFGASAFANASIVDPDQVRTGTCSGSGGGGRQ